MHTWLVVAWFLVFGCLLLLAFNRRTGQGLVPVWLSFYWDSRPVCMSMPSLSGVYGVLSML